MRGWEQARWGKTAAGHVGRALSNRAGAPEKGTHPPVTPRKSCWGRGQGHPRDTTPTWGQQGPWPSLLLPALRPPGHPFPAAGIFLPEIPLGPQVLWDLGASPALARAPVASPSMPPCRAGEVSLPRANLPLPRLPRGPPCLSQHRPRCCHISSGGGTPSCQGVGPGGRSAPRTVSAGPYFPRTG